MKPLISVICSTFNHERFVAFFINSLLKQTYNNWELIIIDDCSTDNNVAEIKKFTDERIHFYQQSINSGAGIVLNRSFELSKGDIIVECASDDAFREDYFEKVIEVFSEKKDVGVIYSSLKIINFENEETDNWKLPSLNRVELLRKLFFEGNCLYSPGLAVRREFYKLLLPMNFAFVQHQDYQWHIKLLINTNCELLYDFYVFYRFEVQNSKSLSRMNIGGKNRYRLEEDYLMDTFLGIKDLDLVRKITNNNFSEKYTLEYIPFLLGKAAINSNNLDKASWGYRTVLRFFDDPNNFNKLNSIEQFTFKDLLLLSSSESLFDKKRMQNEKKSIFKELKYYIIRILNRISEK